MGTRTLYLGRAGSGKTRAVLDRLATELVAGRGDRSLLLVPTHSQAEHLKRVLLSRAPRLAGFFDESIVTFTSLAEKLVPGITIGELLTGLRQRLLLRHALGRCEHPSFVPVARYPGFHRAALAFLKEVKQNGLDGEDALRRLAAISRFLGEVARERLDAFRELFAAYEEARSENGLLDHEDFLARSRDALRDGDGPPSFGFVGVDGFQNFTRLEREILLPLTARAEEAVVTLSYHPALEHEEGRHFRVSHETYLFLLERGFRREVLSTNRRARTGALARVEERVFGPVEDRFTPDGAVRVLAGADPEDEADRIARTVRRLIGQVRLRDVLIIARDVASIQSRLSRAFSRHGLPLRVYGAESPAEHPYARSSLLALEVAAGSLSPECVLGLLRSDAFAAASREGLDRLEDALADGGTPRSPEEWCDRVRRFEPSAAEALARLWEHGRRVGELDPGGWPAEIRGLLGDALSPLWERDRGDEERVRREAWAYRAFDESVGEVTSSLAMEGRAVGLAEILGLMRDALGSGRFPFSDRRLETVNLVDAREARQWEAPVVFVTGLVEGEFPRRPREDIFLAEIDRMRVNRGGDLSLRELGAERDEERFLFYVAVTRARERLYLTYPLTDGTGEESAPSTFLTDLLSHLEDPEGELVSSRRLADPLPRDEELSGVEDLRPQALLLLSGEMGGSEGPIRGAALHNVLLDDPGYLLAAGIGARFALTPVASLAEVACLPRVGARSPSALEDFVECPFKHFAARTLGLRPGSAFGARVDRRLMGEIAHEVLRRAFLRLLNGKTLPDPARVECAYAEVRAELCRGRSAGLEEERELRSLLRCVVALIEAERKRLATSAFRPRELEAAFGRGRRTLTVGGDEDDPVRLCGRLDRIDEGPRGDAVVIDYKLRSSFGARTKREIAEGREIQIPAYLLALRDVFGYRPSGAWIMALEPPRAGGFVIGDGPEPSSSIRLEEDALAEMLADLADRVVELTARIRAGEIEARPRDPAACGRCDFSDLCRLEPWNLPR